MEEWALVEGDEAAHWIKLRRDMYLLSACNRSLPKSKFRWVATERIALAQAPGRYIELPVNTPACSECERLAKLRA